MVDSCVWKGSALGICGLAKTPKMIFLHSRKVDYTHLLYGTHNAEHGGYKVSVTQSLPSCSYLLLVHGM